LSASQSCVRAVRRWMEWLAQQILKALMDPACGHGPKTLAVPGHQEADGNFAETMRLLQYRLEHRLEVAGRAVDDLQDLGGCGLLLQRLARLGDETRVLDRYHSLRGEALQERDFSLGEKLDLLAGGDDLA